MRKLINQGIYVKYLMQNRRCDTSTRETKITYIAKVQTVILGKNDVHAVI